MYAAACLFALILLTGFLNAQSTEVSAIELKPGQPIRGTITIEESRSYTVNLSADRFIHAEVRQYGLDVMIEIIGPDGETIKTVDSPTGQQGVENIILFSEQAGLHTLKVKPFEEGLGTGEYEIEVVRLERAARGPARRVDQIISPWDRKDSPGAAVKVVRDGRVLVAKGYGMANLEYDLPISPITIFNIGSISKQFTAYAIGLLEQEGKLALDDDIRKHLEYVPDLEETITIRQLLHHTSGLREMLNGLVLAGWRMDDVITREHVVSFVSRMEEVNFPANDEYLYCNTGYFLLGEIVQSITGQPFTEWAADNIFKPLQMNATYVDDDYTALVPKRAYSYSHSVDKGGFKKELLAHYAVGAGGIHSTTDDLARWLANLRTHTHPGPDLTDFMLERGITNDGDTLSYARGVGISTYRGLQRVGHAGGHGGFVAYICTFPEVNTDIIVLSNLGSFGPSGIAMHLADIFLDDLLADEEGDTDEAEFEFDPATFENYAGDFTLDEMPAFVITFTREEDRYYAEATGQPKFEIFASSDTTFYWKVVEAGVTFHRDAIGKVKTMTLHQNGDHRATRLPEEKPEVNLADYTGSYYSPELQTTYTLVVESDTLIARHQRHEEITLSHLAGDQFSSNTWFFNSIEFEWDDDRDHVTTMLVSNSRVRDMRFVK